MVEQLIKKLTNWLAEFVVKEYYVDKVLITYEYYTDIQLRIGVDSIELVFSSPVTIELVVSSSDLEYFLSILF